MISPSTTQYGLSDFSSLFDEVPRVKSTITPKISNQLFFTTNEEKSLDTLSRLKIEPITGNTIIAVSGLFGLNILATRMSAAKKSGKEINAFIVIDKSSVVKNFWKNVARIIRGNLDEPVPSRKEAILTILELITRQKDIYFPSNSCPEFSTSSDALTFYRDSFFSEILDGSSFAYNDERFYMIQTIFRKNCFQFLDIDITDPHSFFALTKVLTTNKLIVDTAYISNIGTIIPNSDLTRFYRLISQISHTKTLIVYAIITGRSKCGIYLSQSIQKAWEFELEKYSDELRCIKAADSKVQ